MTGQRRLLGAGASKIDAINQGGGDKKAGLVPTATGFWLGQPFAWNAALGRDNGRGTGKLYPFYLSISNQHGGVGRYRSQTRRDSGVNLNMVKQSIRSIVNPLDRRYMYLGKAYSQTTEPMGGHISGPNGEFGFGDVVILNPRGGFDNN